MITLNQAISEFEIVVSYMYSALEIAYNTPIITKYVKWSGTSSGTVDTWTPMTTADYLKHTSMLKAIREWINAEAATLNDYGVNVSEAIRYYDETIVALKMVYDLSVTGKPTEAVVGDVVQSHGIEFEPQTDPDDDSIADRMFARFILGTDAFDDGGLSDLLGHPDEWDTDDGPQDADGSVDPGDRLGHPGAALDAAEEAAYQAWRAGFTEEPTDDMYDKWLAQQEAQEEADAAEEQHQRDMSRRPWEYRGDTE